MGRRAGAAVIASLIASAAPAEQTPAVAVGAEGLTQLRWGGSDLVGPRGFAVERLVFERRDPANEALFGRSFSEANLAAPRAEVQAGQRRVVHHYPWGRAELACRPGPDRVALGLTLVNDSDRSIADFRVRLVELAFEKAQPALRSGIVQIALDRPLFYKALLPKGKCFITYEGIDPPVQFGVGPAHGPGGLRHDLVVLGGAPGMAPGWTAVPPLGRPRVPPKQRLRMTFVVRFGAASRPDADVLRPYLQAYREAHAPHLDWPDRRPIGKVVIPSAPPFVTPHNPRGWFRSPQMDVRTAAGRAEMREKLMALADRCIERLKRADAQGMFVWNIEGGHVYADTPMGDPRRLADIALEMDAMADAFFARFRDAGLRTGVCIRPSLLHYSKRRQRWTHNSGVHDPAHETSPSPPGESGARRAYPLAERMAAKIAYAKKRWGCTLFYIQDNGYWWRASQARCEEWMLLDAHVLRRLRKAHPDVLLIPRYAERHWRPARSSALLQAKGGRMVYADSLRGLGAQRIGGLATPEWVVGNLFRYRHVYGINQRRAVPDRSHALRESYWASAAPYVELKLRREIRDHVLTLEQHNTYTEEQAERMAAAEIAFEATPGRVRDWMPEAFTVIDLDAAPVGLRQGQLMRAAAWGDILLWDAGSDPNTVRSICGRVRATQDRLAGAAGQLGLIRPAAGAPPTPVSLVWRRGVVVDAAALVADRPVPDGLRIRCAPAPDRRSALLMLAWRGTRGRAVRLKAGLPGIELAERPVAAWQLASGAACVGDEALTVQPDPTAGLSTLLLRAGGPRPAPRPEGVLLAATFDGGIAPTLGGGPPGPAGARPAASATTKDGALLLDGRRAAAYTVVPDWFGGTVEFDLRPLRSLDAPLPVLRLSHCLDLELSLEQKGRGAGLALRVREEAYETNAPAGGGARGPAARTAFAALPGGPPRWHHVVLLWQLGQYGLYVDGKQVAAIVGASQMRHRDASVLAPGVVLGGGRAKAAEGALLDNLVVYNWAFADKQAASRGLKAGLRPPARRGAPAMDVWVWGTFPKQVTVGVNARACSDWNQIRTFRIMLYERLEGGRRRLAMADVGAHGGVAVAKLDYKRAKLVQSKGALAMERPELSLNDLDGAGESGDLGDIVAEMNATAARGKPYTIVVQPMPKGAGPAEHSVNITAGKDGVSRHRW
jgi:hypothetical protein